MKISKFSKSFFEIFNTIFLLLLKSDIKHINKLTKMHNYETYKNRSTK